MGAMMDHMPMSDETKPALMGIMNGRYKEALILYAQHFCGKTGAASAQIIDLNETSLTLRYYDADGSSEEKVINYTDSAGNPVTVSSAGECRRALVDMAKQASEGTGVPLALPHAPSSSSSASASTSKLPGAQVLNSLIDLSSLECLNQDDAHPLVNAIKAGEEGVLQSDADVDHQIIIKVGFRQPVKLKAICFYGSSEDQSAPQLVKVFLGRTDLGFEDAQDQEPVQSLELSAADVDGGEAVQLRFVKFQNVTTIQLFVENNFGASVTRIQRIEFLGVTAETVDMKAWKAGPNPQA